jgi:hypothetical protein
MLNFSSRALLALFIFVCVTSAYGQTKVVVIPMFGDDAASKWRGAWVDETAYKKSDIIEFDGSSYIAVSDHQSSLLNIPPADGLWNVVAASGANGAAGSIGNTGAKGEPGAAGAAGSIGNTGAKGEPGAAGAVGGIGNTGAKGEPGAAGAVGGIGNTGVKGEPGIPGMTGPQGTAANAVDAICVALGSIAGCDLEAKLSHVFPKLVFVTSTLQNGNLGGLEGADDICQGLAVDQSIPGVFKAWLSDSTGTPATRFIHASLPYALVDGTVIADSYTDLVDGTIQNPVNMNEVGAVVSNSTLVFTGTNFDGHPLPDRSRECMDWATDDGLGFIGSTIVRNSAWTQYIPSSCALTYALYCFEQ